MPAVAGQDGNGVPTFSADEPQIVDLDSASQSLPNSQSSDSAESAASQLSRHHFASQNTSQTSIDHTSQSIQLTHEREVARLLAAADPTFGTALPSYPQDPTRTFKEDKARLQPILPALDMGLPVQGSYRTNGTHGQKRSASGHIKTPNSSQTTSPVETTQLDHSRKFSNTSNTAHIGELSAQLKTRLSYAMVKVQNGWQTKTIDEVESLASQHGSPISTAASPRQQFTSPRTNMMQIYRERTGFAESSERSTAPQERGLTAPHLHQGTSGLDHAYLQGTHAPSSPVPRLVDQPHRTNENITQHGPSLAPPVDFGPRHPRRSNPTHHAPPLYLNSSTLSVSSTSSTRSTIPATPPQKRPPAIKTPSQKTTAMEKDAIESLLFMSSPGNSQRQPNHAHLASPLRSTFLPAEKHVGFVAINAVEVSRPKGRGLGRVRLETDENIEKALDAMEEGESSSDEDEGAMSTEVRKGERVCA